MYTIFVLILCQVWLFGDTWCTIWLAVDVWMCTASILNLCAISLDRYVAVTRPVSYPSIMNSGRAKLLIAGVWVLSFFICFPPLVGWKDHKADSFFGHSLPVNETLANDTVRRI
jgi:octopamine receptor